MIFKQGNIHNSIICMLVDRGSNRKFYHLSVDQPMDGWTDQVTFSRMYATENTCLKPQENSLQSEMFQFLLMTGH